MIYKLRKKSSTRFTAAVICFCVFSPLSSQAAFAQDFSSIDNDLQTLENLINDTLIAIPVTAIVSGTVVWAVSR